LFFVFVVASGGSAMCFMVVTTSVKRTARMPLLQDRAAGSLR
jgi:hypothetical protein